MSSEDKFSLKYILSKLNIIGHYYSIKNKFGINKIHELEKISIAGLQSAGLDRSTAKLLLKTAKNILSFNQVPNGVLCINHEDLEYGQIVGRGRFGIVFEGTLHSVKIIVKSFRSKVIKMTRKMYISLDHPNLVKFIGLTFGTPFLIITSFANGPSLRVYLDSRNSLPPIKTLIDFCIQICDGLLFLHMNGIIHGSLCAQQVIIHNKQLKISDYNIPLLEDSETLCRPGWLSLRLTARADPELLESKDPTPSSDVWAYAVTLWEIFAFNKLPWDGLNVKDLIETHQREILPRNRSCPVSLEVILRRIWMSTGSNRPTCTSVRLDLNSIQIPTFQMVCDNEGMTDLVKDDYITVVDLRDQNVWIGQNHRTLEIVEFPSKCVKSVPIPPSETVVIGNIVPGSLKHIVHREPDGTGWGHFSDTSTYNYNLYSNSKTYDYSNDKLISFDDI